MLPTFLIIGAAKSGTTSLMAYLKQHPEIFVPVTKEPNYFALESMDSLPHGPASPHILQSLLYNWSCTDWEAYRSLFAPASYEHRALGEGSVRYLYSNEAPLRIKEKLPDVRLVVILREPVARLYSHYSMNRQVQLEPLTLADALEAEDERVSEGWGWDWHYARVSLYTKQLERYFSIFPRSQIAVFFYDELVADPLGVYSRICRHIGVSTDFRPDMSKRGMVTRLPRNSWLDKQLNWPGLSRRVLLNRRVRKRTLPFVRRVSMWNSRPVPPLPENLKNEISLRFQADAESLSKMLSCTVPWEGNLRHSNFK